MQFCFMCPFPLQRWAHFHFHGSEMFNLQFPGQFSRIFFKAKLWERSGAWAHVLKDTVKTRFMTICNNGKLRQLSWPFSLHHYKGLLVIPCLSPVETEMSSHLKKYFQNTLYSFEPPEQARYWYVEESSLEGDQDSWAWCTCPIKTGWRNWACSAWSGHGLVRSDSILSISKKMLLRRGNQDLYRKV